MRVLPAILLGYLAIGLQLGLGRLMSARLPGGGVALVDLPLVAAAGVATLVGRDSAATAAFLVGLAHDLASDGPIGARAVGYALAGLVVSRAEPRTAGVFALASAGGVAVAQAAIWLLNLFGEHGQTFGGAILTALFSAVVAALLAWPFWRLRERLAVRERRM